MKRAAHVLSFILAILLLAMMETKLVNWATANPWMGTDWVSPKSDQKPPTLSTVSPLENDVYHSDNITLSFNAQVRESITATYERLMQVYYTTDWNQTETYAYKNENINIPYDPYAITEFSCSVNLTGIPEGKHWIKVQAVEWGAYIDGLFVHMFSINGSSSVNFFIDVPPRILVLSPANSTYDFLDVPLCFTVSEPVSQMAYSLDGKGKVSIPGNITLTGLDNGEHNLTIYAEDKAGNSGVSEIAYFTITKETESKPVTEPFPTTLIIASVLVVAVVAIGLFGYFKKRKHSAR